MRTCYKFLILFLLAAQPLFGQIKTITGGGYQFPNGSPCAGCILYMKLLQDAVVTGTGQIAPKQLSYTLDANGNVPANSTLWFNDQLTPSGLTYIATLTYPGGGTIWGPEYLILSGASPLNLAQLIPVSSSSVLFANPAVLSGNNVFTGNNTMNGSLTVSGALNCTIVNAVPCVDTANHAGWTGADACAWINSAQSSATGLNNANGTIDARGLTGSITCAGTLAIGSTTQGVTLLLGGVKLFVQNTVTVAQASRILGSGNSSGSVGTNPTWIVAGASFPTSGVYLITAGPSSGVADAISIRDAFIDCSGITGCKGLIAQNIQENSDFTNLTIVHNLGNGFDITGASEDFKVQGVNVIAGAAATTDNCFTLGISANHIVFDTIGCTGQYASTASTGAGILCTGCNMEVIGFHTEAHADGILLSGQSPNHGYVTVNGINNSNNANGVSMTNLTHVASNWGGTLRLSGSRLFVGTNNVKNDESAFNHVCTDAVLNKYDLGWATGNPNAIQLDTDCSTLPTIRSATFAISGTTAGNFTPDATALFDIRGPSATFNGVRLTDTTSGNSFYFGPGAGTTGFGIRDQLNSKQQMTCPGNTSACTFQNGLISVAATLPTDSVYGTYRVTADQTITAGASLANIPGLTWTMPANTALNVAFSCHLLYNESTAATSAQFGIQDVTVAPTSLMAKSQAYISASTFTAGNLPALTTTTATAIVTFTPSAATTVWNADIDGMIEQPSNASTSAINIMAQFTTNNGTIKRGSFCRVW